MAPVIQPEIPWGIDAVLPMTLELLEAKRLPYTLLEFWYDVDRPADVRQLRSHLPGLARQGEPIPEHTVRVIAKYAHLIDEPGTQDS